MWKQCRSCGGSGWYKQPWKGKKGVSTPDGLHLSCRCAYENDGEGLPPDPENINYNSPDEDCGRCQGTGIFLAKCNCAKTYGKAGLVWVPNPVTGSSAPRSDVPRTGYFQTEKRDPVAAPVMGEAFEAAEAARVSSEAEESGD